jgi:anti-anti-sigma factor
MTITHKIIGDICILNLPENIFEKSNSIKLLEKVNEVIEDDFRNVILDMTEIKKIDGCGLGLLLKIQKNAVCHNTSIRLYGLKPYVAQIIFQTRLNRILDICHSDFDISETFIAEEALPA